jgi:hypothetical protein
MKTESGAACNGVLGNRDWFPSPQQLTDWGIKFHTVIEPLQAEFPVNYKTFISIFIPVLFH